MCCELIGKKVRILFEDLGTSRSKVGEIISQNTSFIEIKTDNRTEFIPIVKIIRIEKFENGD